MSKNYKDKVVNLGYSDIATLILKSPCNIGEVHTGSDGSYKGYLVDETVEIPDYYKKVKTVSHICIDNKEYIYIKDHRYE